MEYRLVLQADWKIALNEKDRKIWFHHKRHGNTEYKHLTKQGDDYICDEGYSFTRPCPNTLRLSCTGTPREEMTFVAPSMSFKNLHTAKKSVNSLDVTEGGLAVSTDSEHNLCIWQTDDGTVRRNLHGHVGEVYTCRFFPSGLVVLSSGADMQLKIWCAQRGQCVATLAPGTGGGAVGGHRGPVQDTGFVDRGRQVVSASKDGTVRLWDVATQTCLSVVNPSAETSAMCDPVNCCVVQSAASLVRSTRGDASSGGNGPNADPVAEDTGAVGGGDKVVLYGLESGQLVASDLRSRTPCLRVTPGGEEGGDAVNCCCFLETEWSVCCGSQGGAVVAWDARNTSSPLWTLSDGRSQILALKMVRTAEVRGLLAGTGDGSCCLIGPDKGDVKLEFSGPDCEPVTDVSTDESFLYTASRDGCIRKYLLPKCFR